MSFLTLLGIIVEKTTLVFVNFNLHFLHFFNCYYGGNAAGNFI